MLYLNSYSIFTLDFASMDSIELEVLFAHPVYLHDVRHGLFSLCRGFKVVSVHGDKAQHDRTKALSLFKEGKCPLMVSFGYEYFIYLFVLVT